MQTHELQDDVKPPTDNKGHDMLWIIVAVTALAIWLVARRKKGPQAPELPPEPSVEQRIREAIRVLEEPREIYEGRWFKHTVKMVECDPPAHVMRARQPPPTIADQMQRRAAR